MLAFKRVRSNNVDTMRLQDAVIDQFDALKTCPFLDGIMLTGVVLSGSTTLAHKLGRQPQGWFTTDRNAAVTIYRTAWTTDTITLVSSSSVTVNLWVF